MSKVLQSRINPSEYENEIYEKWLTSKIFHADEKSSKPPFTIVIPPPNVTGSLHLGHALDCTLQDILSRYHRLNGYEVLWQPGTDHAGIATQNIVEKELIKEGTSKNEIGREKFIERVWKWKEESGNNIINQLKKLGCSCDWDRLRFTMDDGLSDSVKTVFVKLYNEGLIYRSNYMVNWCVRCNTAISDLEVEFAETDDFMYHLRYPINDGSGDYVEVATTRPETFFADTAVAINTNDERHQNLKGKSVILPIVNRVIPVIEDDFVDTEFGTGIVKITPAHDPNDFVVGKTHNLEMPQCIDLNGKITVGTADEFDGLDRYDARKKVVEKFRELSLLGEIVPLKHNVGKCYRCSTTIEPMISLQWFVDVKDMAKEAVKSVKNGDMRIVPSTWDNTFYDWMNNIRDWCISRQIWWGHRIPAYYCDDCNEIMVSVDTVTKCSKCGSSNIRQETDVLDTWFSSALWPFSTLGFPEETETLKKFYPTSVLVTGFDILFFWVVRMMMMGLKVMDKAPFKDIYLHALVRDEHGNKMSKSKGNVIDPLVTIEEYGADALRFTLTILAAQGRDIKLSVNRIEGYRNFINKIWNASRFVLMNCDDVALENKAELDLSKLVYEDKWILMQLETACKKVAKAMTNYSFNEAANELYQFFWLNFCDFYLEIIKPRLHSGDEDEKRIAINTAKYVIEKSMIALHPFIPFITEHLYGKFTDAETICFEEYPSNLDFKFDDESFMVQSAIDIINSIRNIRGEHNIAPSKGIEVFFEATDPKLNIMIETLSKMIKNIAKVDDIITDRKPDTEAVTVIGTGYKVMVVLDDLINIEDEIARLEKELKTLEKDHNIYGGKLKNENYLAKAKADIIEKDKEKFEEICSKMKTIKDTLVGLKSK